MRRQRSPRRAKTRPVAPSAAQTASFTLSRVYAPDPERQLRALAAVLGRDITPPTGPSQPPPSPRSGAAVVAHANVVREPVASG